jgi:segregation and condensation protein B
MRKEKINLKKEIEAIIFYEADGIAIRDIADFLNVDKKIVFEEIRNLLEEYQERGSGLSLVWDDEKVQMTTSSEVAGLIDKFSKSGENLSQLSRSLLEVLTIIAYKGPISRAGVEYIRGVGSHLALRKLLSLELIEKEENPEDSRSYLYKTGLVFLKKAGINRLEDLPEYDKLSKEEIFNEGEKDLE